MGNANSILIYDSVCSLEYSLQPNPKFIITSNINTFLEEVVAIENDILSFRYHLDFYIRRNRSFFAWFFVNEVGRIELFDNIKKLYQEGYIPIRIFDTKNFYNINGKYKNLSRICFEISIDISRLFLFLTIQMEREYGISRENIT
jgi:hypothetical protein